uniref:5'-(N(7)-methylguanosine 5'-triphospho)-[mRNA] hydrolase n=1 Tax=Nothobranchius kuhntae TaxID=321403 RepID=A0A1A8HVF1_NOTKU
MTTPAASISCLTAKGLDISLAALQRQDPYINNIVDVASQVALYTYNNRTNEWEKTEVEGTLFIYTRLASPRHGFTIMNRLSMENLTEPITKDLDFQLQDPFLLYRNARLVIHGIWFYDKQDCRRIAQRMEILTHQEQVLAQSQGGWLSPGGTGGGGVVGGGGRGSNQAKGVDIIQMLTIARSEYDKSTSEPKEIGGSSVLSGNPNLIKPIPVKPNTQNSEATEPRTISLATLFGSQHHHSPESDPAPPVTAPTSTGKLARPPVARTLTYDDAVNSGRNATSSSTNAAVPGSSEGGVMPLVREESGRVIGPPQIPTVAHQNQHQHCPAIAKLMQGQRGAAGVGGVLHTVPESPEMPESPENRLCDNGVPLEHHLHHHHPYHHHHHEPQSYPHQHQPDPIKRLLQTQPAPPLATSSHCCSNTRPHLQQSPLLSSQPGTVESVACSNLQAQQNHQVLFSLARCQTETQSQTSAVGTGPSPQMQGVVSPHELLQKLQLVQQEQNLPSHDLHRPFPALAPHFQGSSQEREAASLGQIPPTPSTGQKAALPFQVISPQRIPATVAPAMLLSPSVFAQAKSSGGFPAISAESCPAPAARSRPLLQEEIRALSKSQLQAALLHLIQTDGSFLDSIYEAYVSRFANGSSSKY